jgi:hypothetical protein
MNTIKKTAAGAVLGGGLLAAGGLGLAHAAPPVQPAQAVVNDGKVNVTVNAGGQEIGVLQNVPVANAEILANTACPGIVQRAALDALDTNGTEAPGACTAINGVSYTFAQNTLGNSEMAPGQNRPASAASSPNEAAPMSPGNAPMSPGNAPAS